MLKTVLIVAGCLLIFFVILNIPIPGLTAIDNENPVIDRGLAFHTGNTFPNGFVISGGKKIQIYDIFDPKKSNLVMISNLDCIGCRDEIASIKKFKRIKAVKIILLSSDPENRLGDYQKLIGYSKGGDLDFVMVSDVRKDFIGGVLHSSRTPTSLLVDQNHKIVVEQSGYAISDDKKINRLHRELGKYLGSSQR